MNNVKLTLVEKPRHIRIEVNGQIIDASQYCVEKTSDGSLELHLVLRCDNLETVMLKNGVEHKCGGKQNEKPSH